MKEELRKLNEITAQVRYMSKHNISTLSDLNADREKNQSEMNKLIGCRQHLRGDGAVRQINRHFVVKVNDKMYS